MNSREMTMDYKEKLEQTFQNECKPPMELDAQFWILFDYRCILVRIMELERELKKKMSKSNY